MNCDHTPPEHHADPAITNQLDRLAQHDRSEPGATFERSICDTMRHPTATRPIPGRRRPRSAAWVPMAAAAFVGVFAYIAWPTSQMVDSNQTSTDLLASASDDLQSSESDSQDAEILLASFETMDSMFVSDDTFTSNLDQFESHMDAATTDVSDMTEWMDLGESL